MSIQEMLGFQGFGATTPEFTIFFVLLLVWSLVWKGIALWKAARNKSKVWYVIMLIANTVGILEIIYIFFFSKKKEVAN